MDQRPYIPETLYHVLLTISHISKNPNDLMIENLRVPGTYTSLLQAKAAAHSCLYEAGYEKEFFETYEVAPGHVEGHEHEPHIIIHATATDGTTFRVRIRNTRNETGLPASDLADGRVSVPLYYVIQVTTEYVGDEGVNLVQEVDVRGVFTSYAEARKFASRVLLSPEDGITKDTFVEYSEAGPGETDCGFGENVVVHAALGNGTKYLLAVVKTQELEALDVAEAAMRIR
ncbi:hypothetical protein BJX66DRAFT_353293 [Aspergillus keveii]|uniref:Uncharacterized protein n=1 Tax=Aspergillus keveii TaxID=714993 RepID=A0ABR4FX81_9EURO